MQILEYVPPNYAAFAEACATSFLSSPQHKFRTKELAQLLRGLFVLNFDVGPHANRILQAWKESWSVVNRQGRDNILCATNLARMGIFDREYIRFIIDEANASPKLRAAATESELIEGAFEMLRRHTEKGYTYDPRHRHQLEWDRSRRSGELKSSLAMVSEVDALVEIFHDSHSLPRLDPELRAKLARLFIRDSEATNQTQNRLAALRTMRESFGPDIIHGLSYPYGGFPDIVCCLRKVRSGEITTVPLPEDFTAARLPREIVRPPPIRNGTW